MKIKEMINRDEKSQFSKNFSKLSSTLAISLPETVTETLKMVLCFESVDEILWFDHSNETSSAVLSHATIFI